MSVTLSPDAAATQVLSTSLDPYGQLIKMLLPRASCIGIYDRTGMALWASDGCEAVDLHELVEEAVTNERTLGSDPDTAEGFARSWNGESAYVFFIRNGARQLQGAVGLTSPDTDSGARPFSLLSVLLRPALEVLGRELTSQCNIGDLQKNLSIRDGDLELLLGAADAPDEGGDDFAALIEQCLRHLGCSFGAITIPDKNISVSRIAPGVSAKTAAEVLSNTHRHLLAWSQVQRRTMAVNKVSGTPLVGVPYKMLSCPILEGSQGVAGILTLFKAAAQPDFDLRQIRIVESLTRRIAHVLRNAYDPITGLLTRPAFEKRALAALNNAPGSAAQSVIYIDLDRLHVLNENHGMHIGDEVIAKMAALLRSNLTQRMIAARISGDRFAVFLPETGLEAGQQFASHLCRSTERLNYETEGKRVDISASFGIAPVKAIKHPLSHALAEAEAACKAAKDRGRGRVEAYQDADVSIIRRYEDVLVIGSVKDAIANDRFRLDAQPIIDLQDPSKHRRFELLLRMIGVNGESIAPDKFLTAAERYQLASAIDRWVVQFVLEFLSAAADRLHALGVQFAVNISGQSLGDSEFLSFLEEKLQTYSLPPQLISFEITETAAVTNIVNAELLIQRLQALGYEVALDDFGRGLSSLTYLKTMPVTYLKIDGGLVRDVVGNQRAQAMISAIVQLARAMKLKTTAECIESQAIQDVIAELGVDCGQGFSIGRPRPLELTLQELLGDRSVTASTLRTENLPAILGRLAS